MGFRLEQNDAGLWEWEYFNSAYGWAGGEEETLARAKVELTLGQASVLEEPFPPIVAQAMREDPERFAADFPDPPYENMMRRG